MNPQEKNISIIHNCEDHLFNWMKIKLKEHGFSINEQHNLSDILFAFENRMDFLRQHIKSIKKWNKIKDECYSLSSRLNGSAEGDERLNNLVEQAAFEGQILWLTIQED